MQDGEAAIPDMKTDAMLPISPSPESDTNAFFGGLSDNRGHGMGLDIDNDFNLDTADWLFWDQLIQGHQAQGV